MKQFLFLVLCIFAISNVSGQSDRNYYWGINVLTLTTTTLNTNYEIDIIPSVSSLIDLGYTFNYEKAFDLVGTRITPHCKCGNEGYNLSRQSGGYLRLGAYLNFRKDFEVKSYPHIGLFFTNAIICEKGMFQPLIVTEFVPDPKEVSHTIFVFGLSLSFGYEFSITKRLKSYIDFQNSFPNKNYHDLYGYRNYIPGMGFKDSELYWFPMFILNLRYKL
jgi:hypothetical protein